MRNFQGSIFIWIRTYREIFNSTLVYLEGHNGFIHDVSVTLINKTDGKTPTKWERP